MAISQADLDRLETNIKGADDWVGGNSLKNGIAANGQTFKSITQINADAQVSFDNHLSTLGFEPPIAFVTDINVNRNTLTVEESGDIFAPLVSEIPFTTTGVFNASQWYIITDFLPAQATNQNKILTTDGTTASWSKSATLISLNSLTALSTSDLNPSINDLVRLRGATTPGDGGHGVWKHNGVTGQTISQLPSDLNSFKTNDVNGDQWELVSPASIDALGVDTMTIQIPTEFADIQAAMDYFSGFTHTSDQEIVLNLETGFEIITQTLVQNEDLSFLRITSTDAEVLVGASMPSGDHIISGFESKMPVLDCLINANGNGRFGYSVQQGSYGFITAGSGVKNARGRALYVNKNSNVLAETTIWTGSGSIATDGSPRGCWVTRGSTLIAEAADFSDSESIGIYVSRASTVHAMDVKAENCLGQAVWVHRSSRITAHSVVGAGVLLSTQSGSTDEVVRVNRSSIASFNADAGTAPVTITQNGSGDGVTAGGASSVNINEADLVGGVSSDDGIDCSGGATVSASSATITGFDKNININGGSVYAPSSVLTLAKGVGVQNRRGRCALTGASVTGSVSGVDINNINGGITTADNCTTTNGVGTPALADTNMPSFNTLTSNRGTVYT